VGAKLMKILLLFYVLFCQIGSAQLLKVEYEAVSSNFGIETLNYYFDIDNKIFISENISQIGEITYQYEITDFHNKTISKVNSVTNKIFIDTLRKGEKINRLVLLEQDCNTEGYCKLKYIDHLFNPFAECDTSIIRVDVEVDFKHELGNILFDEFHEHLPGLEAILNEERGIILYLKQESANPDAYSETYILKIKAYSYVPNVFDFNKMTIVNTFGELMRK